MRPVPPMTTIFMILPSEGVQGVSGCVVFDPAKDAGSAVGKPCAGLEARLNFAWVSVQDSGTKEQDDPRKRPAVPDPRLTMVVGSGERRASKREHEPHHLPNPKFLTASMTVVSPCP